MKTQAEHAQGSPAPPPGRLSGACKVPGPPSTATKLAFTCKFIVKNKQKKLIQSSRQKYLPLFFIEFRNPNIELRNADHL